MKNALKRLGLFLGLVQPAPEVKEVVKTPVAKKKAPVKKAVPKKK